MHANELVCVPPDLIRPGKAARMLGLHITTIYRWILKGRLPAYGVGPQVRVSVADVVAQVKRREARNGVPLPVAKHEYEERQRIALEGLRAHGVIA